jgi:hypothetical protein
MLDMGWINKFRHTNLNNNKHNNKIEALQRQLQEQKHHPQPPHEDIAEKLKKYADLKQQGILTEEELLKLDYRIYPDVKSCSLSSLHNENAELYN